jgi:hypothetical protein
MGKMRIVGCLLTLILMGNLAFLKGQSNATGSDLVQISGYVIQADSLYPIPFAHIINPGSRQGVISDGTGYYNLVIRRSDTLEFQAIGYEVTRFFLPEETKTAVFTFNALLKPLVYDLETYKFNQFTYDRVIDQIRKMGVSENEKSMAEGRLRQGYYSPRPGTGVLLSGPFTKLYEKFSKQAKEMEKLRSLMAGDVMEVRAQARLTPEMLQRITGLAPEDLDEFVKFCNLGTEFVAQATTYDVMVAVGKCHEEFLKAFPELRYSKESEKQNKPVSPN